MSLTHNALRASLWFYEKALKAVSKDLYFKTSAAVVNDLNLVYVTETPKGQILFHCNSDTVRIRARDMLIREPDTIAWIQAFGSEDTFWDIGSNIGVFTLFAALSNSVKVCAFDPLPYNYASLVRNVTLNGMNDRVMPFCVALSSTQRIARLRVPIEADTVGGAGSLFDQDNDNYGTPVVPQYELTALGYSIDGFLTTFDVPFPNHLKIDIDGLIDPVVAGAKDTLRDPRLKSAMIELQPRNNARARESFDFVTAEMADAGFRHDKVAPGTPSTTADPDRYATNNFFVRETTAPQESN